MNAKVFILIDISGSTSEEQPVIGQSLELFYKWLNEEQKQNIEYWVFGDNAAEITYGEYSSKKEKLDMSTHVASALKEVNKEVQRAIEKEERVYVIVISDLMASEKNSGDYTWEGVVEEQENVDMILKEWSKLRNDDLMDIMFITWNKNKNKKLSEIKDNAEKEAEAVWVEEIRNQQGFRCDVESQFGYSSPVYELSAKDDSITGVETAGCLIKRTAEMLDNTKMIIPRLEVTRKGFLNLDSFYKAYVVMEQDKAVYAIDGEENINLSEYRIETENMALYCLPLEFHDKKMYLTDEENYKSDYYLFYEEMPEINISTEPDRIFEENEIKIICSSKRGDLSELFPQIFISVKAIDDKDEYVIEKEPLVSEGDGKLITEGINLKHGKYRIEIYIGENSVLESKIINVSEKGKQNPNKRRMGEDSSNLEDQSILSEKVLFLSIVFGGVFIFIIAMAQYIRRGGHNNE